jgi:hypothetical protein
MPETPICQWTQVRPNSKEWSPECVNRVPSSGSKWKFCPYCGKPLVEVPYTTEVEADDETE